MTWLLTEVHVGLLLNGPAAAYGFLADDCCWTRHCQPDLVDDETGSPINQNDVRRRTTCLEQSTGVNSRPNIISYYCIF